MTAKHKQKLFPRALSEKNICGFSIRFFHNDISGIANLIDTGFTHSTNYLYTLRISKKVNSRIISVVLEMVLITTGVKSTFSYDITNDYTTYGGYLAMYCIDGLGVTETSIVDFGSLKTKRLNYL